MCECFLSARKDEEQKREQASEERQSAVYTKRRWSGICIEQVYTPASTHNHTSEMTVVFTQGKFHSHNVVSCMSLYTSHLIQLLFLAAKASKRLHKAWGCWNRLSLFLQLWIITCLISRSTRSESGIVNHHSWCCFWLYSTDRNYS